MRKTGPDCTSDSVPDSVVETSTHDADCVVVVGAGVGASVGASVDVIVGGVPYTQQ